MCQPAAVCSENVSAKYMIVGRFIQFHTLPRAERAHTLFNKNEVIALRGFVTRLFVKYANEHYGVVPSVTVKQRLT